MAISSMVAIALSNANNIVKIALKTIEMLSFKKAQFMHLQLSRKASTSTIPNVLF